MPTITAIVPSPDKPGHVVILVDGAPFATVPASTTERLALAPGTDAEDARVIGPLDPAAQRTYDRALNVLGYRERSARDLRRRLIDKGEPPELVELVIARLIATGLLDDARFASQKARVSVAGRARAPRRVAQDLARRGVARDVAATAIADVMADEGADEAQLATRAAEKKLRSIAHLPPLERRHKLFAYLARQGFSPSVVRRAVDATLAGAPAGRAEAGSNELEEASDEFEEGVGDAEFDGGEGVDEGEG